MATPKAKAVHVLHDGVLLSLHGENGKVLFGFISKVNIQELLDCFEEKNT